MKFLGIGEYCDLGALYVRLIEAGHEVKVFVENADYQDIYAGMLTFTPDWRSELEWIRHAGQDGIILFESASKGILQDKLRQEGYQVIGGSAFGDLLESNREFGQQMLQEIGLPIANTFHFTDYDAAIALVTKTNQRYVYKSNGADCERTRNYVGMAEDGSDLVTLLKHYKSQKPATTEPIDFVLMDYISGIEIGVGVYFNGEHFLQPACLDWEHKHFFNGNLGELTGEMGTVVTFRGAEIIFKRSLLRLESRLKQSGYCGYINLNMIANADGLWPLEFTSRFGYPGYCICAALQQDSWASLFKRMLRKTSLYIATQSGFAVGVVLNVPPFPYSYGYESLSKGLPILFQPSITKADMQQLHFSEVAKQNNHLMTSGVTGNVGTAVGAGETIEAARQQAYNVAEQVILPNIRYRQDIGADLLAGDLQQLIDWGYINFSD
ncbi:MAG: phosphoribosylamine--glycine ligase [Bdellovibrio sp.]|nr:phosphoribosylamine--glycine ligase [Methylotenera sp.]